RLAAAAGRRLGARDRFRDTRVVNGAFIAQARDRLVYRVGIVSPPRKPLTDLKLRELAPREHREPVAVRIDFDVPDHHHEYSDDSSTPAAEGDQTAGGSARNHAGLCRG